MNCYEAIEVVAACPLTPALSPDGREGENQPVVVIITKMKNSAVQQGHERNRSDSGQLRRSDSHSEIDAMIERWTSER
jgi:hypothetical protein